MYTIKFLAMLTICFVVAWAVIGTVFTAFSWGISNYPGYTIAGILVAYLFAKEAAR